MRKLILFVLLLLLGGAIYAFLPTYVVTYSDTNVIAGEINRPIYRIVVHSSKPQYLVVKGKTYRGVRGLKPHYLRIPDSNSILIVTEDRNRDVMFHIVDLKSGDAIDIDGDSSSFGWGMYSQHDGGKFADYIESVQSNCVTIVKGSLSWKEAQVLDLTQKRVTMRMSYDHNDKITNQIVLTNVSGQIKNNR